MSRQQVWPVPHPLRFEVSVPVHPLSVAFVRKAVRSVSDVCGSSFAEMVALVFTEVVTNVIRHSGLQSQDHFDVQIEVDKHGVRGLVRDSGPGFDPGTPPQRREDGGFGLFILDRLARRWGVEHKPGANEVWFEF